MRNKREQESQKDNDVYSIYYLADFYKFCHFNYNNPCMHRTIREVANDTAIGTIMEQIRNLMNTPILCWA